jgi:hypothetical protein
MSDMYKNNLDCARFTQNDIRFESAEGAVAQWRDRSDPFAMRPQTMGHLVFVALRGVQSVERYLGSSRSLVSEMKSWLLM